MTRLFISPRCGAAARVAKDRDVALNERCTLNAVPVHIGSACTGAPLKDFRARQSAAGFMWVPRALPEQGAELFQIAEASRAGKGKCLPGDDPRRRRGGANMGTAPGCEGKRQTGFPGHGFGREVSCGAPYSNEGGETPLADVGILSARNDARDAFATKLPVGSEYSPSRDRAERRPQPRSKTQTTGASQSVGPQTLHAAATARENVGGPNAAKAVEVPASLGGANPSSGTGELTFFGFKRGLNSVTNSDRRGDGARAANGRAIRTETEAVLKTAEAQALGSSTLSPFARRLFARLRHSVLSTRPRWQRPGPEIAAYISRLGHGAQGDPGTGSACERNSRFGGHIRPWRSGRRMAEQLSGVGSTGHLRTSETAEARILSEAA